MPSFSCSMDSMMPAPALARRIAIACLAAALLLAAAGDGRAMREAPPIAQTGGFGEETCQSCHFQADVDAGPGRLAITGVPERFEPGRRYLILITLSHPGVAVAGFQLSVRFEDGIQAGSLAVPHGAEASTAITSHDGVQYAHHLLDGTAPAASDSARWALAWVAPDSAGTVLFHAVANAGNDDDSPLGDFVYTARARSRH
jgi:hypothetical protein